MKWNIVVGSLVIGASLSSQSFGGDLLNRLLSGKGSGANSSCCDTVVADPSCGVEIAPCNAAPSCGVEIAPCNAAPSCGVEIASCDPCGAPACDSPCGFKKPGLLSKLFAKKNHCGLSVGCEDACDAAPACNSCTSAPVAAPAIEAAPEAAPAAVADPHAYLNTKRHVIQASSTRIR